jgi:pyruvate/2-oxoglutarate dehydrogenase complex dihydrolipoamide dehydrogenase (E3) component
MSVRNTNSPTRERPQIVVRNALFFWGQRMGALTVPWCTYTDPQIAHVGMSVSQARGRKILV